MMLFAPDATASSTPYWIIGLSTSGSISFGCAFVAGRKRVPRPAAGNTALRIFFIADLRLPISDWNRPWWFFAMPQRLRSAGELHPVKRVVEALEPFRFPPA